MAIRAILFDFDGTLAPNLDLPDMRRQVIHFTQQSEIPETVWRDQYIVEIINTATTWLQRNNPNQAVSYNKQAHQLITDFEVSAARDTQPFPGMRDLLQDLRQQEFKLGVVTRNCRAAVLAVFPDLLDHVDALYARDDTEHLKPDGRHLLSCLESLDRSPSQAAMVGDGALDMSAGRALDMYCIGVLSGSGNQQILSEAGAHEVIQHCADLRIAEGFRTPSTG